MPDDDKDEPVTFDRCVANAELETDLSRMKQVNDLADSWVNLDELISEHAAV